MRCFFLMIAVVALVGCGPDPSTKEGSAKIIERNIRIMLKKPTGELTKSDYEKVTDVNFSLCKLISEKGLEKCTQLTRLVLIQNQLTDVTGLEKLTNLKTLNLGGNKLTDVKGLEKLTRLTELDLQENPDLTKAQIAELQKALPECKIYSDFD